MSVNIHIINTNGLLNNNLTSINAAFQYAVAKAKRYLKLETADVVVGNNPDYAIPELGVGGYTDSHNKTIHLSIDSASVLPREVIEACLDHEFYHLARHGRVGRPKSLRDRTIDEGLACLYEFEINGVAPVYAKLRITKKYLNLFIKHADDSTDTDRWFFGGDGIPKWFAYSLGYNLVKRYKNHTKQTANQMLGLGNDFLYKEIIELKDLYEFN